MEIQLRDGIARVDDEDADLIAPFTWHSTRTSRTSVYAYTTIAGQRVWMHHLILNVAPRGQGRSAVDHRNGDGLDNRRVNLRRANNSQNSANRRPWRGRSRFKGVSWSAAVKAWQAHVMVNRRSRFLGCYEVEEDAARAYDLAAHDAFGEYAHLNFPDRLAEPPPVPFSIRAMRARDIPDPAAATERPTVVGKARFGDRNNNAKLSETEARQIVAALREVPRRTQASIAQQFGVSQAHVSRIAQRKNWSHLWND